MIFEQHHINRIFDEFKSKTVLIIGDLMIDEYRWGKVERISPEAPVPVVNITNKEHRLGGAANVGLNIAAMGAKPILCGLVGNDSGRTRITERLSHHNLSEAGLVVSEERPTCIKTRIISQSQQLLRLDEEDASPTSTNEAAKLKSKITHLFSSETPDLVIFEDYDKGTLNKEVIGHTIKLAQEAGIPTSVDPKKRNFNVYGGVTMFKPNLKELEEGLNKSVNPTDKQDLMAASKALKEQVPHTVTLLTLSEHGVYVGDDSTGERIPAHLRSITDVSGAGDTVIAVASLGLSVDLPAELIARLANLAGGLVCEKVGVVPIDAGQLESELQRISR